jgi:metal-responsive CopG/Arc/MetJ family transcriptional regulator
MHTLEIELPDELAFDIQKILNQQDIKQFALDAIKAKLLQEQKAQQQKELMALIADIKPAKALLSSEEMVRYLREGKDHELTEIMTNNEQ